MLPSEIFPLTVNTNKTLKNKYYNNHHVHKNYIYVTTYRYTYCELFL